jgi:hypothetical protein
MNVTNSKSAGNRAYPLKETASRVMVVGRPKLIFDQIAAPVPTIMDTYTYFLIKWLTSCCHNFYINA